MKDVGDIAICDMSVLTFPKTYFRVGLEFVRLVYSLC